jgi:DNA-binding XRE family transcriptional regulator
MKIYIYSPDNVRYNISMKKWTPQDFKSFRKKYKLSQRALGDLVGVTEHYIYLIERGMRNPSKTMQILLDYIVRYKLKRKGDK